MSIIDTLTNHIPDSVLDQVHALQQRRLKEIDEHGTFISLWPSGTAVKSLRDGNNFCFNDAAPIKLGTILRDGSEFSGTYLVTEIQEQAGRISAHTTKFPATCSVFRAITAGVDMLGRAHYRLQATNWQNLPCSPVTNGKVCLPLGYTPEKGDVLLVGSEHWQVLSTKPAAAFVEVAVEEF